MLRAIGNFETRSFRRAVEVVALLAGLLFAGNGAFAQGGASHFAGDTTTFDWEGITKVWNWVSKHVGGDLFISYEMYGLHLSGVGSLTRGYGPGAEIRVRPVFLGAFVGFCDDEGISGLYGTFSFAELYAGTYVRGYRAEIGEVLGDNYLWTDNAVPRSTYSSAFLGVSKRLGNILFVEPGIKVMFPTVARYKIIYYGETSVTEHYHLRDLFFAFNLKVGIGVN